MDRGKYAERFTYMQGNEIKSEVDEFNRLEEILSTLSKPIQEIESITSRRKYEFGWQPHKA
ncbi:MAG: hypothetical protein ACTSVZ_05050 [Promethearchaeota archaeon]